jgi:hypothetical protein
VRRVSSSFIAAIEERDYSFEVSLMRSSHSF